MDRTVHPQETGQAALKMLLSQIEDLLHEGADSFVHGGLALVALAGAEATIIIVPPSARSGCRTPDDTTPFHVCSLSKHFVAAAALQLADEGLLDLHGPCGGLLPEFLPGGAEGSCTLKTLMTMRTGLGREGVAEWGFDQRRPKTERLARARFMPLIRQPETGFTYSNLGYIALGLALERTTGRSINELLESMFFAPLGLRESFSAGFGVRVPDGAHAPAIDVGGSPVSVEDLTGPNSEGSARVHLSPRDALAWLGHLAERLNEGPGRTGLSGLGHPHTAIAPDDMPLCPPADSSAYGCGLFMSDSRGTRLLHHGGAGRGWRHQMLIVPEERCGLMLMASTESARLVGLSWDLLSVLRRRPTTRWIDILEAEAHGRAERDRSTGPRTVDHQHDQTVAALSPGMYSNPVTGTVEIRESPRGWLFLPHDAPALAAVVHETGGRHHRLVFEHPAMARQPLDPEYRLSVVRKDDAEALDVTYFGELVRFR
jgi:CubicO group peptidase (beta-lactamase class C family)